MNPSNQLTKAYLIAYCERKLALCPTNIKAQSRLAAHTKADYSTITHMLQITIEQAESWVETIYLLETNAPDVVVPGIHIDD